MDCSEVPYLAVLDWQHTNQSLAVQIVAEDTQGGRILANTLHLEDTFIHEDVDAEGCGPVFCEVINQIIWNHPCFNPELVAIQTQTSSLSEKHMARMRPGEVNR